MRFTYKHLCIRVLGSQLLKKKEDREGLRQWNMTHRLRSISKRNKPFASRLSKSPLFFSLVGYTILKNFSYLSGAKFGDVMTIDQ